MTQVATERIDGTRIEPAHPVIDRVHLAQMTLGDRNLERELLRLFEQQAGLLIARMRSSEPAAVAALAHTLKGSALGIGAPDVAEAAAAAERVCAGGPAECVEAIDRLAVAVEEARAAAARWMGGA
jgi:HPt (histidine-containing phosphotransfer) domain-containing protein